MLGSRHLRDTHSGAENDYFGARARAWGSSISSISGKLMEVVEGIGQSVVALPKIYTAHRANTTQMAVNALHLQLTII
jgi:hypothetical protein